ncbi:MAG TPA: SgcJ/EcaC family oxidoreductase [Pirellulales bacterium]|nr:SgcJ/EcaC family oxidoreductase [Pirellulales bacterium]
MSERLKQSLVGGAAALGLAIGIVGLVRIGAVPEANAANPPAAAKVSSADDEKSIRATADEFVKAFNAGDAKTIGAEWAADAEYTDEAGQEFHGRAAIEKEYATLFKDHPGSTISLTIESIRFLGPDIALERGIAKVKQPHAEGATAARYNVTHVRRDGKWQMVVGRDSPYVSAANDDYLKDLEWMIGEWKPEGKGLGLQINSEWLAGRNFIKITYTVTTDGKPAISGAQIIGWNPRLGKIVAWHFDAQGGFGNDVWTKEGSKWVIRATGIFRDGSESSAVNTITPIDANSFTFESDKRTLDRVGLPNLGPVKLVRVTAAN